MKPDLPPPVWQPVTALPVILELAGAQIEEAQATFDALARCRLGPHVLDDATLARTCQIYGGQRDFLAVQREQIARWRGATLTPKQEEGLSHLSARTDLLAVLLDAILALAKELSHGTIDRLIGMSDAELAAAVASGALRRPRR